MDWLTVIGISLQLVGALLAASGLRRTWSEWAPAGEGFFDPVTVPARATWRRIVGATDRIYRRILRRRRQVDLHGQDAIGFGDAATATVHVDYTPLSPDLPVAVALGRLDRRTQELRRGLTAVEDEQRQARSQASDLSDRVETVADQAEALSRRVAIGGIRRAALGLILVGIGTFVELLGAAT